MGYYAGESASRELQHMELPVQQQLIAAGNLVTDTHPSCLAVGCQCWQRKLLANGVCTVTALIARLSEGLQIYYVCAPVKRQPGSSCAVDLVVLPAWCISDGHCQGGLCIQPVCLASQLRSHAYMQLPLLLFPSSLILTKFLLLLCLSESVQTHEEQSPSRDLSCTGFVLLSRQCPVPGTVQKSLVLDLQPAAMFCCVRMPQRDVLLLVCIHMLSMQSKLELDRRQPARKH